MLILSSKHIKVQPEMACIVTHSLHPTLFCSQLAALRKGAPGEVVDEDAAALASVGDDGEEQPQGPAAEAKVIVGVRPCVD